MYTYTQHGEENRVMCTTVTLIFTANLIFYYSHSGLSHLSISCVDAVRAPVYVSAVLVYVPAPTMKRVEVVQLKINLLYVVFITSLY